MKSLSSLQNSCLMACSAAATVLAAAKLGRGSGAVSDRRAQNWRTRAPLLDYMVSSLPGPSKHLHAHACLPMHAAA